MRKSVKTTIAAVIALAFAAGASIPACAHGGRGQGHHAEETHCGWTTIDGKQYYYNSDGSCVNKSCVIDGVRYKFSSDGVCQGTYTGWVKKSDGSRHYYCGGEKQCGWVCVESASGGERCDWYYIDPEKGRLTGKQTINGREYRFDSKGRWDKDGGSVTCNDIAKKVTGELSKRDYGGVYISGGMCVILSVDGKAEKAVSKWYPEAKCVVFKKADYSLYELEKAAKKYFTGENKSWLSGVSVKASANRICVMTPDLKKYEKEINRYIEKLPCKDMVIVEEGGAPTSE